MPRELVALAPRTPALRSYDPPALDATQVRIHTEFAAPKHGTELNLYRGHQRVLELRYDPEWGSMQPQAAADVAAMFPRPLGNMAVGTITEAGSDVHRLKVGDRVFGHMPIREVQTVDESRAFVMPPGLTAEAAVCLDPAVMAFAMRDATIKLGDRVAVFGLGAIGLMAMQLAQLAGAAQVIGVDPIAERRAVAQRYGTKGGVAGGVMTLDPGGDSGMAVRRATLAYRNSLPGPSVPLRPVESVPLLGGYREVPTQWSNLGVDVAVEVSGNPRALHDAIRATRFGGIICLLSYFGGEATGLRLGEEFHVNRLTLISCRSESLPMRDAPGWTLERTAQTCLAWLAEGRLSAEGMVTPIVPFAGAADAYREIDERPERSIKLGIRF